MDKKTQLIIGGSVGGAAIVGLVVTSIVLANQPAALILRATANTISDARKIEAFAVAEDVANGGSVAVSANLDSIANDDVYVQAKYYSDAKNLKGAYEMTMTEDDDIILDAQIAYNQDKFAFSCPELFDGAYGVTYKNVEKNLPGSIFDPDEETDYSLDDEQFAYFLGIKDTIKNDKNLERDIDNMITKYRQLAVNSAVKHAEVGKGSKTITVGDEKLPCTLISLSLDEDSLALVVEDLVNYANNDKDLEKLLRRVAANGSYNEDPDEYIDQFYDNLDQMEESIDDLKDSHVDIQVDFYITSSGRRLARLDAEMEVDDESVEISLVLGKNVAKSKEISLTATTKSPNYTETVEFVYTVEEDSSRAYEAELNIEHSRTRSSSSSSSTPRVDEYKLSVEWDRKSGDFEFKLKYDDDNLVLKGSLLLKGDTYTFVLSNLRVGGTAVPYVKSLDLTIKVDKHDPAPNVPGRFTEITTMNERDFKHLTEDIEEGIEKIQEKYFDRW